MVINNEIPPDQLTDEEQAMLKQIKAERDGQPQQPDPNLIIAQAEDKKAQAQILNAQNDQQRLQTEGAKVAIEADKLDLEADKLTLKTQEAQFKALKEVTDANVQAINTQADSLKKLVDAVDKGLATPELMAVIRTQINEVAEEQAAQ